MKNFELKEIIKNEMFVKDIVSFKFAVAFSTNKTLIKNHLAALESIIEPSQELKDVYSKIEDVKMKYCKKDENGQPIITQKEYNGQQQSTIEFDEKSQKTVGKEIDKLVKENESLFDTQDKKQAEYLKAMNDECGLTFSMVNASVLPDNISLGQFEAIKFMVNIDQ